MKFDAGGCGSVGRAVDSDSRGPWFESNYRQNWYWYIYCELYRKDEKSKVEVRYGPFLQKLTLELSTRNTTLFDQVVRL